MRAIFTELGAGSQLDALAGLVAVAQPGLLRIRAFLDLNARDLDEAIDQAETAIESWWKERDLQREDPDRDDL